MFCQNCGSVVDDSTTVCPTCGTQIAAQGPEAQAQQPAAQQNAQAYSQPAYQQPDYQQPGYQQPGYQQPAYQQPGYQQPGYAQPAYQQPGYQQPVGTQKSRLAAGLLGIFLGTLGIHNFYLGRTGRGLVQLLVSVLTLGIGAIPMGIWALVESILILTGSGDYAYDAKGIPLAD